jgi:hypothetical protein
MDSVGPGVVIGDRRWNDDVGPTDEGDPMTDTELDLDSRLSALASRAPGRDDPPDLRGRRRGRFAIPLALAPILVLATVATVAAGAAVVGNLVGQAEGIENPGQPLAGARMECMTPLQAAAFLAAHGYTDVVWQVETGDASTKAGARSVQQATPPQHGYVVPGAVVGDGRLHMVVDQRVGATGVGACYGMPMP